MILVAVGANLPASGGREPIETCRQAVAAMNLLPGLRVRGLSRWYESAPVPPSGQPPYVNAVVHLAVEHGAVIDPAALLAQLMAIETANGRTRGVANAARTLDLDIIAMGGLVRSAPDPILPHPRAHERAFVLAPLAEVAPAWRHPVLHRSVSDLLAALPSADMRVL
jgi:2-amino-4-hydroxy-6-hydroxymethyldihydropteridine diphosphokinase